MYVKREFYNKNYFYNLMSDIHCESLQPANHRVECAGVGWKIPPPRQIVPPYVTWWWKYCAYPPYGGIFHLFHLQCILRSYFIIMGQWVTGINHVNHPKMVTHLTHDPWPTDPFPSLIIIVIIIIIIIIIIINDNKSMHRIIKSEGIERI